MIQDGKIAYQKLRTQLDFERSNFAKAMASYVNGVQVTSRMLKSNIFTYPTTGRAADEGQSREDIALMKEIEHETQFRMFSHYVPMSGF